MLEQSWKKVYSRTTTKSIILLHPEQGFYQQNKPERGRVQHWYPNEKMVVVSVCLNGRCCSSGRVGIISYSQRGRRWVSSSAFWRVVTATFLKYLREGRLSSNHAGIRNIPSDVCYDGKKTLPEAVCEKQGRCDKLSMPLGILN